MLTLEQSQALYEFMEKNAHRYEDPYWIKIPHWVRVENAISALKRDGKWPK